MTSDMIPFDYAGLPTEAAELCRIVESRIKTRTGLTLLENGRDLLTVKNMIGYGRFTAWLESWFPLDPRTARKWMAAAEKYQDKTEVASVLGSEALCLLAAPSTPDPVREEIERRVFDGGDTSAAEIRRLTAEFKAKEDRLIEQVAAATAKADGAKAETAGVRRDLEQLQQKSAEKAAKASRREANLIEDKNRALADKAAAEARTAEEVKRAQEAAWAEADEKYETLVRRLNREAAEARRLAEEKTKALDAAVAQARAEAEQAAKDLGEALAAKALETRKSELDKLDAAAAKAEARVATAARTEAVLQGEIRKHEAYLAKCRGEEAEALEQIKLARDLSEFLGQKMAELTLFEYDVQPLARPKILRAAQMCGQMAQALDAFLAPRLVTQGGVP